MNNIKEQIAQTFEEIAVGLESGQYGRRLRVGITLCGSEHGEAEVLRGAELAQAADSTVEVVAIGSVMDTKLTCVYAEDMDSSHKIMDDMLESGGLDAAVTMHYNFPIGVSTIGRVTTPAFGKKMLLGSTTGTSDTERTSAMIKNAISSIAVAKACGNTEPTVGILNIEGARQVERSLQKLKQGGYPICFTESSRADGGVVMRGNDLLQGVPDIMVMDSLTGNVMVKTLSAFSSGGSYEALGDGYGPGVGLGYDQIVNIISRASGAPVIAGAIGFAAACAKGNLPERVKEEYALAQKAGLNEILDGLEASLNKSKEKVEEIKAPPEKVVTEEIAGIEIFSLEDAVQCLWKNNIYATSGMGCTGPVVLVAPEDLDNARDFLRKEDYL